MRKIQIIFSHVINIIFSGAKLAPFGWGGERVHRPAVM